MFVISLELHFKVVYHLCDSRDSLKRVRVGVRP